MRTKCTLLEFNRLNILLQTNFVLAHNTLTVALATSEADVLMLFMRYAPDLYATDQAPVVGSLAQIHGLKTDNVFKLTKFPKTMEALRDLAPLVPFFPQWRDELPLFALNLISIQSEMVSRQYCFKSN